MRRVWCRASAVGVAAAAVLAVAGCGQQTGGKAVSALEAVRLAAAHADKATTAHVTGTMTMKLSGAALGASQLQSSGPITFDFTADEQWQPTLALRYTMSGMKLMGVETGKITALMTDKAMYMSMPMLMSQTGKKWLEIDFADAAKASGVDLGQMLDQARQMDPSEAVRMLTASGDLRRVGTETVDGVETTHYAGTVQTATALKSFTGKVRDQAQKSLKTLGISSEHVDVWIDSKQQVRRTKVSAHGANASIDTDMHVSRYGEAVDVSPPPASDTLNIADLMNNGAHA